MDVPVKTYMPTWLIAGYIVIAIGVVYFFAFPLMLKSVVRGTASEINSAGGDPQQTSSSTVPQTTSSVYSPSA